MRTNCTKIIIGRVKSGSEFAYPNEAYVIRTKNRDQLHKYLEENGISTLIHYPIPLHLQNVHKNLNYKTGDLSITEQYANEILSLPMFPEITEPEIKYVAEKIKEFINKNK